MIDVGGRGSNPFPRMRPQASGPVEALWEQGNSADEIMGVGLISRTCETICGSSPKAGWAGNPGAGLLDYWKSDSTRRYASGVREGVFHGYEF